MADKQKYDVDIILQNAAEPLNHIDIRLPEHAKCYAQISIASSLYAMAVMLAERDGKKEED